ncbi:MAG: hypothetical protein F6J97_13815 [Leptolyngbya sp. SIO4C1]|nr:hypothetical protein [Leptolyngbya sp. SIO4C1]
MAALGLTGWLLSGCQSAAVPPPRAIQLEQQWVLEPGDRVAGHEVTGSLGDVSIQLEGHSLYAPFTGQVAPATQPGCVIYATPDVPAYLFRLCGLAQPALGAVAAGQPLGSGDYLHFATMRRQPSGTWTIVEPSTDILERAIDPKADRSIASQSVDQP